MKTRTGFVSNSSSSSFIIDKKHLTTQQIELIKNHSASEGCDDPWDVEEKGEYVVGSTWMDNFDMEKYLREIGVPMDKVEWGEMPPLSLDGMMDICRAMEDEERFAKRVKEEAERFLKTSAYVFSGEIDRLNIDIEKPKYTQHPDEIKKFVNWLFRGFDKPKWEGF
jgi:hypothetical protein